MAPPSSCAPLEAAAAEETPHDAANGRGRVSPARDVAASVDARGPSAAGAAVTHAACTDREIYADAAPALLQQASCSGGPPRHSEKSAPPEPSIAGPTESAALEDGGSFARAVAARVDLVGVSARLLCRGDEKIQKAELDRIRQLLFESQNAIEEPPRIDFGDLLKPLPGTPDSTGGPDSQQ